MLVHTTRGLFSGCDYPMWAQYLLVGYMMVMIVLFSNFYIHEYVEKSNEAKRRRVQQQKNEQKIQKDLNNNELLQAKKQE